MRKRYARGSQRLGRFSALAAVLAILIIAVVSTQRPRDVDPMPVVPDVPEVSGTATAVIDAARFPTTPEIVTIPVPATFSPEIVLATSTPLSVASVDTNTVSLLPAEEVLPAPPPEITLEPVAEPTPEPEPTATEILIPVIPDTPTPAPPREIRPTAPPTRDPNKLPNGVTYGDPRPAIPNRIVRIASPDVDLDAKVYEVYIRNKKWEVAEFAAGHHYNSVNPGDGGNIVLNGHNNWKGEVFRYLEFIEVGDLIQVWTLDGKEHHYRVTETKKVKEAGVSYEQRLKNAEIMNPTAHEQLTLITCWPYTTFTHRILVTALPVEE